MFMEFIDENGKSMGGIKLDGDDGKHAKSRLDIMSSSEFVDFYKTAADTFVSMKEEARKAKESENNVIIAKETSRATIAKSEAAVRVAEFRTARSTKNIATVFENLPNVLREVLPILKMFLGVDDDEMNMSRAMPRDVDPMDDMDPIYNDPQFVDECYKESQAGNQ